MKTKQSEQAGFTLVEAMIGMFVLAMVISGSLVALGTATTLSEKSRKQTEADFYLRAEIENLRTMTWTEVSALVQEIDTNSLANKETPMKTLPADSALTGTLDATLRRDDTTDQIMFHIRATWVDRLGKDYEESRVILITEGGLSASS